jgi:hypothetical protein
MEMVLVDVVSRGTGGLPCALLGDILAVSAEAHPVITNKPAT